MSKEHFSVLLYAIVSDVIRRLVKNGTPLRDAIVEFYQSSLYLNLSDMDTGLWHLSTDMLLDLFENEKRTGDLNLDFCI